MWCVLFLNRPELSRRLLDGTKMSLVLLVRGAKDEAPLVVDGSPRLRPDDAVVGVGLCVGGMLLNVGKPLYPYGFLDMPDLVLLLRLVHGFAEPVPWGELGDWASRPWSLTDEVSLPFGTWRATQKLGQPGMSQLVAELVRRGAPAEVFDPAVAYTSPAQTTKGERELMDAFWKTMQKEVGWYRHAYNQHAEAAAHELR